MSQNMQSGSSSVLMDKVKWIFAVVLLITAIVASYYYQRPAGLRWGILIVGIGASLGLAAYTPRGRQLLRFCIEARAELRKVVWPTREETIRATFLILGMIFLSAILLWAVDSMVWRIVAWVTGFKA